ncbi:MAG: hypothetical protein ACI9BV_003587 [Rhodothermales bacterium]
MRVIRLPVLKRQDARFADFPSDYASLPTVSVVIPTLEDDMHDGLGSSDVSKGDAWLQEKLGGCYRWAKENNSLLILTFDEDGAGDMGLTDPAHPEPDKRNRIATILAGRCCWSRHRLRAESATNSPKRTRVAHEIPQSNPKSLY